MPFTVAVFLKAATLYKKDRMDGGIASIAILLVCSVNEHDHKK